MTLLIEAAIACALASALAAVLLGEVLTRSIVAASAALAAFGLACLAAGGSVVPLSLVIVGLLSLAIVQLFGWMLVDVDHDHLPRLSLRTASARGLALVVFAAALGLLGREALRRGELAPAAATAPAAAGRIGTVDPSTFGGFLFGAAAELPVVLGCLLAAALLTALCLLRDEGADPG